MTISPTVTSDDGICTTLPPLSTFASGPDSFFRLASDCSAFTVWTVPRIAFIVITIRMTAALSASPMKPDTIAAIIRMITRKSLYCSRKI